MSQQQYAQQKLQAVSARIAKAEQAIGRAPGSVTLIGASKKQSPERLAAFVQAGLSDLGENYLQEAISKQSELTSLTPTWHFIGQIQSNKTKAIAQHFTWVHGIDRLKIARRIAQQNSHTQPIKLLIQLNLDGENSKGGVSVEQAPALADEIAQCLQHLSPDNALDSSYSGAELRGFMAIPMARADQAQQRATFARAQETLTLSNQRYDLGLNQLSMGMSGDLEAAIAEGATMVRIGTDLFGARE